MNMDYLRGERGGRLRRVIGANRRAVARASSAATEGRHRLPQRVFSTVSSSIA